MTEERSNPAQTGNLITRDDPAPPLPLSPSPSKSGGKGGRPKGAKNKVSRDLAELARVHTPAAVAKLAQIMKSKKTPASAAIAAASALLDRGHGKPTQMNENRVRVDLQSMTLEELAALRALFLSRRPSSEGQGRLIEGSLAQSHTDEDAPA